MKHEWYDAAGGTGLSIYPEGSTIDAFAGLIREINARRFEIERYDGHTETQPTLAAAKTRLLAMLGLTEHA